MDFVSSRLQMATQVMMEFYGTTVMVISILSMAYSLLTQISFS